MPKFQETFCSQCGGAFGPGDSGFSHCDQHAGIANLDDVSPARECRECKHWTRLQPDDKTAPEGKCGLPADPNCWPFGYWPHTLQRDSCGSFEGRARR